MTRSARFKWCPGPELNRYVSFETRDFKSRASASFATRAFVYNKLIIKGLTSDCFTTFFSSFYLGGTYGGTWFCEFCRAHSPPFFDLKGRFGDIRFTNGVLAP